MPEYFHFWHSPAFPPAAAKQEARLLLALLPGVS
jgi:hypothetical protein